MATVASLFIQALLEEGVTHLFTVPGEETIDLMEAVRRSPIILVVMRHEQGAGFMASTLGRITGQPAVCLTTLGPGATNLLTAVAQAQLIGLPLVVITGQKPLKNHGQGLFQRIDVVQMMSPITKMSRTITSGSHLPMLVREAFRVAAAHRPGVAHLELPEDIAQEETSVLPLSFSWCIKKSFFILSGREKGLCGGVIFLLMYLYYEKDFK